MPRSTGGSNQRTMPAAAFAAAQGGDPRARRILAERYMPLARSLALRFDGRGEPLDDLIQVAAVGLLHAIDRFDHSRGLAFSSFAVPTITGELRRHFRDRTWGVRMPRQLQERSAKLTKTADALSRRLGRQPTVAELCAATGESEEAVLEGLQAGRAYRSSSLDTPLGEDDGMGLVDVLGGEDSAFADVEARLTLDSAARLLTDRQREVLRLQVDEDLTQEEIAARVGISQMQVSRDLAVAREALRAWVDSTRSAA